MAGGITLNDMSTTQIAEQPTPEEFAAIFEPHSCDANMRPAPPFVTSPWAEAKMRCLVCGFARNAKDMHERIMHIFALNREGEINER
jgi:hypothetical protein